MIIIIIIENIVLTTNSSLIFVQYQLANSYPIRRLAQLTHYTYRRLTLYGKFTNIMNGIADTPRN